MKAKDLVCGMEVKFNSGPDAGRVGTVESYSTLVMDLRDPKGGFKPNPKPTVTVTLKDGRTRRVPLGFVDPA